jgi:hypothetical protein
VGVACGVQEGDVSSGREAGAAFDMAREAYRAERRKLAEMVGEGS